MLMGEVHHRAKNMIAVVQAMVNRTATKDYARSLGDRLHALGRNLDLLTNSGWYGAPIGEVLRSQLAAVGDLLSARVRLEGALDQHLNRAAVETLGLAIHELATNAAKYGALSGEEGVVVIRCHAVEEDRGKRLVVEWEERGGPPVAEPTREGYGSMMIDRNPRLALNAEVAFGYPVTGFHWRLSAPFDAATRETD
jgi:two-component sensor histidine kinase